MKIFSLGRLYVSVANFIWYAHNMDEMQFPFYTNVFPLRALFLLPCAFVHSYKMLEVCMWSWGFWYIHISNQHSKMCLCSFNHEAQLCDFQLTSKLSMASRSVNVVFVKWLPDKFNTFNRSNEFKKSIGMGPISASASTLKWRKFWKIKG